VASERVRETARGVGWTGVRHLADASCLCTNTQKKGGKDLPEERDNTKVRSTSDTRLFIVHKTQAICYGPEAKKETQSVKRDPWSVKRDPWSVKRDPWSVKRDPWSVKRDPYRPWRFAMARKLPFIYYELCFSKTIYIY